jgi:hypothetical protein
MIFFPHSDLFDGEIPQKTTLANSATPIHFDPTDDLILEQKIVLDPIFDPIFEDLIRKKHNC